MNRTSQQALGEWGEAHSLAVFSKHGWVAGKCHPDYGVDLYVQPSFELRLSNSLALVQVKTLQGKSYIHDLLSIRLKTKHLAYWVDTPLPVYLAIVYRTTEELYLVNVHQAVKGMDDSWRASETTTIRFGEIHKANEATLTRIRVEIEERYSILRKAVAAAVRGDQIHGFLGRPADVENAERMIDNWASEVSRVLTNGLTLKAQIKDLIIFGSDSPVTPVEERVVEEQFLDPFDSLPNDLDRFVFAPGSPMEAVLNRAREIALSNASLVVLGETGVGKSMLAEEIHRLGSRRRRNLVNVMVASIPRELLYSELFGHVKGAFTGARDSRQGLVGKAHMGTLFLDEFADLPLDAQAMLLDVVERRRFRALGSDRWRYVDVRLIAATNNNLNDLFKTEKVRRDLFERLAEEILVVPRLMDRGRRDIAILARVFLSSASPNASLSEAAIDALSRHSWPGNVRELRQVVNGLARSGKKYERYEIGERTVRILLEDRAVALQTGRRILAAT